MRPGTKPEAEEKMTVTQLGSAFIDSPYQSLSNYETVSKRLIESFSHWTYANVSTLAEAVSKIEFELYRVEVIAGEVEYIRIDEHEILDLLDRFNPFTTTSEGIYNLEAHMSLAGDAFLLMDKFLPENLFILQPDKIKVIPGDVNDNYMVKRYEYTDTVNGKQKKVTYDPDLVVQIKNPHPGNPYRGKSVVEAASSTVDTSNLIAEFQKIFFQNAAVSSFILSTDKTINEEQQKRIEAELKKKYGGIRNFFKTMILGGGLKPVTVQQSGREMQMIELDNAIRDTLMAMFKNTKASLGITDDVNRANAEATLLGWKQNVIKPKMQRITDSLNEFLVPRYGDNLILTFTDPVPENREALLKEVTDLQGVATINERRALVDLEPLGEEFDTLQSAPDPEQFKPGDDDEDSK